MTTRSAALFSILLLLGCDGTPAADPELADTALDTAASRGGATDAAGTGPMPDGAGGDGGGPSGDSGPLHGHSLQDHCQNRVGPPRVVQLSSRIYLAIGYDLANTILIATDDGNVVVDVSMSPARAEVVKAALQEVAPGPTRAIIYTHSHIDHVGGASVWREPDTEIWATEPFMEHFLKQYGAFRKAETLRGARQFGQHVGEADQPCSAIGRTPDVQAALSTGFVKPTRVFSGSQLLTIGGVALELVEAHGETHDQLFVWLPQEEALLCGDNFYSAFPNLYTIRGTSARPVDAWVRSLDQMRVRDPAILVPSHTVPLTGKEPIRAALRDYRDAISWVVDEVVRGANRLEPLPAMTARVALPPHLASSQYLEERYGQVDWSVKAIYQQELGWFDGRADTLYPPSKVLEKEIALMGGPQAVLAAAEQAMTGGDPRFAAHLLGKLRDAGLQSDETLAPRLAAAYRAVAGGVINTNGRGYLLERAWELDGNEASEPEITLADDFLKALPPELIFGLLGGRLKASENMDTVETVAITITDLSTTWYVTVRRGVVEVMPDVLLPGNPAPTANIETTSEVWVGLSLQAVNPIAALAEGSLIIDDVPAALLFLGRFEQGI